MSHKPVPTPDPSRGQSWYKVGFEMAMRRQAEANHKPTEAELRRTTQMNDADLVEFGDGWNDGAIHHALTYIERLLKQMTDTIERFALAQVLVKITEDLLESDDPGADTAQSSTDYLTDLSNTLFPDDDLDDPPPTVLI